MSDADFPSLGAPPIETGDNCHTIEIAPAGRPDLAFQLALPKGWAYDPDSAGPVGDGSAWTPLAVFGEKPEESTGGAPKDWAVVTVLWRKLEFLDSLHFHLVRGICRSPIQSNGAGKLGPRSRCGMGGRQLFPSQLPVEPV